MAFGIHQLENRTWTFKQDVTMEGDLTIEGDFTIGDAASDTASVAGDLRINDDRFLHFGDDEDVSIEYDEDGGNVLNVTGADWLFGTSVGITFRDSAIKISSGADGVMDVTADTQIELLSPSVEIGEGDAAGTLQSSGNFDLVLQTGNATSSAITITDGAAGDITFALDGAGTAVFTGSGGLTVAAQTLTAHNDSGAGSTINPGVTSVAVVATNADANDWINLPALSSVPDGHRITIICGATSNFEMRTPAASNEEINSEDCDGTKEYLCTDTEIITVVKIDGTIGWMAYAHSAIGAAVAAVVPD